TKMTERSLSIPLGAAFSACACSRSMSARPSPARPTAPACRKLRREEGPGQNLSVFIRWDSGELDSGRSRGRDSALAAIPCNMTRQRDLCQILYRSKTRGREGFSRPETILRKDIAREI